MRVGRSMGPAVRQGFVAVPLKEEEVDLSVQVVDIHPYERLTALRGILETAQRAHFATAFLKRSGFGLIRPQIDALLTRDGSLEMVVGLDFRLTEPQAVLDMLELSARYPGLSLYAFSDTFGDDVPTFHPKLYIGEMNDGRCRAMVGSSNLTAGGLGRNVETNLLLDGPGDVPPMSDLKAVYRGFLMSDTLFVPDADYLQAYGQVYERVRRRGREVLREQAIATRLAALRRREETLPGTVPTQKGLVVEALRALGGGTQWVHWRDVARWVQSRAMSLGLDYKWDTLRNSVRGRLNEHTLGKDGDGLFEREGGVAGRHGRYRLTDAGMAYVGRPATAK